MAIIFGNGPVGIPVPTYNTFTKSVLYGGKFQDSLGNPLANGYLTFTLNHDENVSLLGSASGSQVVSGIVTTLYLDGTGSLLANTGIWTNDLLYPQGSYYIVRAYNSSGLAVWNSPQIWVLHYAPAIDIGSIICQTP